MRKLLAAVTIGALLSGGSLAVTATSATAAPVSTTVAAKKVVPKVTIKKIPTKRAPYGGKATVKPRVAVVGVVSVKSKTLTVKKKSTGKTVVKKAKKARLAPGTYKVTTKVRFQRYDSVTRQALGGVKTKTRTQTLVVKKGKRPSSTAPINVDDCPGWAPIKGNQSGIYHVPGGRWYDVTNPEECFTTESAAVNAGYRASKNG
ncbi:hypothetical protein [Isoptericola dokdonensis]|uniref:Uncharacterized protein n=1 Tax=Isoptericola dokdonensis DS-3 TaxID=1300344 RepID=A0A168G0Z7_9MICO|nr:hypothetical protein [Isoptericola dokdonensis]ANC32870.1 hypothetical protein I598_3361 [Isoptericola dokdonensis DS-3]